MTNKCDVVTYVTDYNIYVKDDYKRCVCDSWGAGENDCEINSDDEIEIISEESEPESEEEDESEGDEEEEEEEES
jgi:hypothetical protein